MDVVDLQRAGVMALLTLLFLVINVQVTRTSIFKTLTFIGLWISFGSTIYLTLTAVF